MGTPEVATAGSSHKAALDVPEDPTSRSGASWRLALRIARRDVLRNRGPSAVAFMMIMLPVLLVVAAATMLRTDYLTPVELLPRQLGAADAAITEALLDGTRVVQDPFGTAVGPTSDSPALARRSVDQAIAAVLGPDARAVPIPSFSIATPVARWGQAIMIEADFADPLLDGFANLRQGRFPSGPGEVAVTEALARRGAPVGSTIELGGLGPAVVVGVVDQTSGAFELIAMPDGFGDLAPNDAVAPISWLVDAPGGVSWDDVRRFNEYNLTVVSREVVTDPPSKAEWVAYLGYEPSGSVMSGILVGLLVTMVLLEIALLAGPAFAVGAAKQTRALVLIAAQGGDRRDVRRIVLAQAVVIGGAAVLTGAVLGVLLPLIGYPLMVYVSAGQVGPFETQFGDALLVMGFGLVAAVAAALLPARSVARLNPVAAMAGRRPQPRRLRWPTGLGIVLIALGAVVAIAIPLYGWRAPVMLNVNFKDPSFLFMDPSVLPALGAALAVIGAVLIAPLAVQTLGRFADYAPMSMRYALRDMARNQLRTAPAVAAVTAVVAGAMTMGVAVASDAARDKADFVPPGPIGQMVLTVSSLESGFGTKEQWQQAEDVALAETGGGQFLEVQGMLWRYEGGRGLVISESDLAPWSTLEPSVGGLSFSGTAAEWYGASLLVGLSGLEAVSPALSTQDYATAKQAMTAGRAVLLSTWDGPERGTLQLDVAELDEDMNWAAAGDRVEVPALAVRVDGIRSPALAILPESAVAATGLAPTTVAALLQSPQTITKQDAQRVQDALWAQLPGDSVSAYARVAVEYHFHLTLWLLVLLAVSFLFVLVGAVTASLLALSDARTDLVTLGEVGAAPGVRRRVAATYGAGIVLLGALLGVAVGVIPGFSVAAFVTGVAWRTDYPQGGTDFWGNPIPDTFLTIPWMLVAGLVLVMPVLVGALLFVTTRSKLPRRIRLE